MCDLVVALGQATADGSTLFAKNSDRPPDERQLLEWHAPRSEARTRATHIEIPGHRAPTLGFVGSRPEWMWGVEQGVNLAGLAAGNATIYTTVDPRPFPDGLCGTDLVRLALERAASAAEAVELITGLIEGHGQGGSGQQHGHRPYWSSFLLADPAGAFVVETSGRTWQAEPVEGTRALSNRTTIPAFDREHRHPSQPVATLVDPRLDASQRVLAAQPVTVDKLIAHLSSHAGGADGWTVCMHVDGIEQTTASMVAELAPGGPPRIWATQGSPCRTPFSSVTLDGPGVAGLPAVQPPSSRLPPCRST